MKLKDLITYLDSAVPLSFQEDYDNCGLQVGDPENEITSAMIALDVTEEVLEEALNNKCDIIISHHPLIFHKLKSITGKTFTERVISKALKNDIAIYSAHTNLDVISDGVSRKMADKLGLKNIRILSPLSHHLLKLITYIPESHFEKVRDSIFEAGAGVIGNYDKCSFSLQGTGSFRANAEATPYSGEKGKLHFENEIRFETILFSHLKDRVVKALIESHPYEEVAYDLYTLENQNANIGLGCIGVLGDALSEDDFLNKVASVFGAGGIRYSKKSGRIVETVALCGGSGASLLNYAISGGADVYLTADVRYHDYFNTENKILLLDIGHYESEKFSVEILKDLIIKKFPKFAVRFSETNTNPINYF